MMSVAQARPEDMAAAGRQRPRDDWGRGRRGGSVFVVDFSRGGNSADYRTFGWSAQEESHVWSLRSDCGLRLPALAENTPIILDLDFNIPAGQVGVRTAVVRVFVDDRLIGAAAVDDWTRLRCEIPQRLIRPGEPIDLRIEHPCFTRMDHLGFGNDDRPLGLCFYAARVYPPGMKPLVELIAPMPPEGKIVQPAVSVSAEESGEPRSYRCGPVDPGHVRLHDGWRPDPDGAVWADRRVCTVEVPAPARRGLYLALFKLWPLYIRSFLPTQRINILLSGAVIGQYRTGTGTGLAIPLPPELIEPGGMLAFTFVLPDGLPMHRFDPAQPPNFLSLLIESIEIVPLPRQHAALARVRDDDVAAPAPIAVSDRFLDEPIDQLPETVKAALGVGMPEILQHFESLGDNCAFGLGQRKGGCEVLGLLRFANSPLQSLMVALDDEFKAASSATEIELRRPDGETGEYQVHIDRYGIRWHTDVYGGTVDEAVIFAQQTMRIAYLRRKFYEALHAGRKILTISRAEPRKHPIPLPFAGENDVWEEKPEDLRFAEVLPLFLKLNEYGTNTLLYLTRCSQQRRSGTVELVAPGVMRGYVDDFVISPNLTDRDHAAWLRVAVNAWLLDRGPNASFRKEAAT